MSVTCLIREITDIKDQLLFSFLFCCNCSDVFKERVGITHLKQAGGIDLYNIGGKQVEQMLKLRGCELPMCHSLMYLLYMLVLEDVSTQCEHPQILNMFAHL